LAGVVNAHDDQRLRFAPGNDRISGLPHVPILPRNERRRAVEQVLAIVQVQHGEVPPRLFLVTRRQIDHHVALVAQESRAKLFVLAKLPGTHGARITGWCGVLAHSSCQQKIDAILVVSYSWIQSCVKSYTVSRNAAKQLSILR
jgi:hypothetical protein